MQIYVVQQGDSLFEIANMYGSTIDAIADANKLIQADKLVVGQALVIPIYGQFYFVEKGDTLFTISQRFHISPGQLAQINGIQENAVLQTGHRLYIPPAKKKEITSNAYIEPTGNTVSSTLIHAAKNHTPQLTYLAPFSYTVNRDGTLNAPLLDDFVQIANDNQAFLMMSVSNLENFAFSPELGEAIVTTKEIQQTLLDDIIKTAKKTRYDDVHFDFEFLPAETKEDYNKFLRTARDRLHSEGLTISTTLAPKTSADQLGPAFAAHDYAAQGKIVDMVVLMTYEWGYSFGEPRAISPIDEVTKVIKYALSVMPAKKIFLGQNLYGYDWTLPYKKGGSAARALSPKQATELALKQQAAIEYNKKSEAPFFHYYDADSNEHVVWFEDARSIQAKFDLIKKYNLLGISYWKLGLSFPQNWLLLEDNFTVRKKEKR